jgi:ppGpp synthetase/RelA/SpoT-type nucleotidyltranferase
LESGENIVSPKIEQRLIREWGFKNRNAFEVFLENSLRDLEVPAQELKRAFEKELEDWILGYLAGQRGRFVARIESPPQGPEGTRLNTLLKKPGRVAEKIVKSWQDYEVWGKTPRNRCTNNPPIRHDPQKFLKTIPDIIRFRIVCNYLRDLRFIDEKVRGYAANEPRLRVVNREDHISSLFPCSRVGHRAIEYTIRFKEKRDRFLFEVQIMTQLQHAWDKKDHHLIYEYIRAGQGDRIPVQLKNRVAAMSELLYVADTIFDEILDEITAIMKGLPAEKIRRK